MQASIAIETQAAETSVKRALALHRAAAELRERRCNARLRQIALAQHELAGQDFTHTRPAHAASRPVQAPSAQPQAAYTGPMEYGFAQARPAQSPPAHADRPDYGFAQARPAQPDPADEELLETLLIAGAQALPFGKAR